MTRPKYPGALILATTLIPALAVQFDFGAAAGVMAVSTMILLSVLMRGRQSGGLSAATTQLIIGMSLVLIYLIGSGLVSWQVNPGFDFGRFAQSLIFMFFCLTGSYYFSAIVNSCTEYQINNIIRFVFKVILFSSVARILGIHLGESSRTVFFYNEPSHYALGLAPFLMYTVVSDVKRRWVWMVSAVAVSLAVQSLTLIIVVLLIYAAAMRPSIMMVLYTLLIVAMLLAVGDGITYYIDRANLSSESTNLSNLVYLSGWERAWLSINETLGLGYGLNQLGIVGDQGGIMLSLSNLNAEGLNALDGGSVASKLIAEFGAAGVLLLIIYLRFFLKGIRFVRSAMNDMRPVSHIELFFWSCFIMYSIDLFVRGAGYFSAESFMYFGAMWGLSRRSRNQKGNFFTECGHPPPPENRNQIVVSVHAK